MIEHQREVPEKNSLLHTDVTATRDKNRVIHGSPTCGPPVCVMRLVVTLVLYSTLCINYKNYTIVEAVRLTNCDFHTCGP